MSIVAPLPMINYFGYLFDAANWHLTGDSSIPERLAQHVGYTLAALLISALIALPLGLLIGHTNRGAFLAIGLGNLGRALPTFGLVLLLVTFMGVYIWPVLAALVVLAIPPILAQTYAGIRSVDPAAVDAAVGMGMRPTQVLFQAEVPMALPLIISGLRSATAPGVRDGHHRGVRQLRRPRAAADRRAEPQPVRPDPRRRHHGRPARDRPRLPLRGHRTGRGVPRRARAQRPQDPSRPDAPPSPPHRKTAVGASR